MMSASQFETERTALSLPIFLLVALSSCRILSSSNCPAAATRTTESQRPTGIWKTFEGGGRGQGNEESGHLLSRHALSRAMTSSTSSTEANRLRWDSRISSGLPPLSVRNKLMSSIVACDSGAAAAAAMG
jgi:hypothetical protein